MTDNNQAIARIIHPQHLILLLVFFPPISDLTFLFIYLFFYFIFYFFIFHFATACSDIFIPGFLCRRHDIFFSLSPHSISLINSIPYMELAKRL